MESKMLLLNNKIMRIWYDGPGSEREEETKADWYPLQLLINKLSDSFQMKSWTEFSRFSWHMRLSDEGSFESEMKMSRRNIRSR